MARLLDQKFTSLEQLLQVSEQIVLQNVELFSEDKLKKLANLIDCQKLSPKIQTYFLNSLSQMKKLELLGDLYKVDSIISFATMLTTGKFVPLAFSFDSIWLLADYLADFETSQYQEKCKILGSVSLLDIICKKTPILDEQIEVLKYIDQSADSFLQEDPTSKDIAQFQKEQVAKLRKVSRDTLLLRIQYRKTQIEAEKAWNHSA